MNAKISPAVIFDYLSRLICSVTIAAATVIMTLGQTTAETGKPDNTAPRLLGCSLTVGEWDSVTGWTDLHYAAAADLPEVVERLVGYGVSVDVRLASGSSGFGERLLGILTGIGHRNLFERWKGDDEMPLKIVT